MKQTLVALLVVLSTTAFSDDRSDELVRKTDAMMVDILCNTEVIQEFSAAEEAYHVAASQTKNEQESYSAKLEFGRNLRKIWLAQQYDLQSHPEAVYLIDRLIDAPMEIKFEFAEEWSKLAYAQCPFEAIDYGATTSAAMTLISSIAK